MDGHTWDALVVGGGPAGGAAAYHLACQGLRVLVLEARPLPRDKPCGGALGARGLSVLPPGWEAVVEETGREVRFVYRGSPVVHVRMSVPYAYFVRRARLDAWLLQQAGRAGATVRDACPVTGVLPGPEGVEVTTGHGREKARFVLLADGAKGRVGAHPGARRRPAVALEAEVQANPGLPLEVDFGLLPGGYGWIFPKGRWLNVGVALMRPAACSLRRVLQAYVRHRLGWRLDELPVVAHPVPVSPVPNLVPWPRVLLAGDRAGLVDAFSGEGISFALRSGALAAARIARALREGEGLLAGYDQDVGRELFPELQVAGSVAAAVYRLPPALTRRLAAATPLARWYVEMIAGQRRAPDLWRRARRAAGAVEL